MYTNYQMYLDLLSAILSNVEDLRDTIVCLLKNAPKPNKTIPTPNQAILTHAQYLAYIAIEELGKFYLILSLYDTDLNTIDLRCKPISKGVGFYDHDSKMEHFFNAVIKTKKPNEAHSPWVSEKKKMIGLMRNFKENNLYIDYKDGKILKPIPNRGNGSFESLMNILSSGIMMTHYVKQDFTVNPSSYRMGIN